jgi:hypothetical protein
VYVFYLIIIILPSEPKYCGAFYEDLLEVPGFNVLSRCPVCFDTNNENVYVVSHPRKQLQVSGFII